jgi:fucose permease
VLAAIGGVYVGAEVSIGSFLVNYEGAIHRGLAEKVAVKYLVVYWAADGGTVYRVGGLAAGSTRKVLGIAAGVAHC